MPDCEAEERNLRAAFEIELQWGAGRIDLGRLKNILTGAETCTHNTPESSPTLTNNVQLSC